MLTRTISKHRFRGARQVVAAAGTLATVGALIAFAGAGAGSAATVADAGAETGPTTTVTFSYTGSAQFWTVPAGVTSAAFDAYGAGGYTIVSGTGGAGGEATGTLAVSAGQSYQVTVGGGGGSSGIITFSGSGWADVGGGGFNGGGGGGDNNNNQYAAGGGGGASDVRFDGTSPCTAASPCGLADRVIVAGGGGGGALESSGGGAGGGGTGGSGGSASSDETGGGGGTQTAGGAAGTGFGGGNDTEQAPSGSPGELGTGGAGASDQIQGKPGGGGGGGYYGGGGGSGGDQGYSHPFNGSGGGGGSSYVSASATGASTTTGGGAAGGNETTGVGGNGWVTVTYPTVPAAPTNLAANAGDSQVTLSWDAPDSTVTGYDIYQGTSSGGESAAPVNAAPVTGTSYTVTGLTDGTTYYFEVTAVNSQSGFTGPSQGPPSNEAPAEATAPQSIAFTSTPPSPAAYGGSYTPAATGGGSGNSVTFSIDSSSTPGACSIGSSGTVSFTGTGTCTIDANQAAGGGYAAAAQAQQSITIGNAVLTVTANDASRLFGAANPAFTTTITGFVNGDTSTVVTGSPSCTSTAQPWSPAGTYPITCTTGTLSAANYTFTFAPGTLTVGYTGGACKTGRHFGPLKIASGRAVCLGTGFTQIGPVTVTAGGALDIEGATVFGPVLGTGAAQLRACGAHLTGLVSITGSTGLVVIGDDEGPACAGNTITGPAYLSRNSGGVEFDHNTVNGPLTITATTGTVPPPDTGSLVDVGNHVHGPIRIS